MRWYPGAIDSGRATFKPPADRLEVGPQLAADGRDLVMAYTRLAPGDEGCGDDGLDDVGVYLRTWSHDDGTWSEAVRLGDSGDSLQSFRSVDGTLHATVTGADGRAYYLTGSADETTRIPLPEAGATSVRVGDDGHARIAYSTGQEIRLARVDGRTLQTTKVATTDRSSLTSTALVLAPGDVPTIIWTRTNAGGGCAEPEPDPDDGTYLARRVGGSWEVARISKSTAATSLTLDPHDGRWHVVLTEFGEIRHLTGRSVDDPTTTTLPDTEDVIDSIIRVDPGDGRLVVVAVRAEEGIEVFTKP